MNEHAQRQPELVISGLALANPYVGQGVYTHRLLRGLAQNLGDRLLVVAPAGIEKSAQLSGLKFCALPPFRAPRNALLNHVIASHHLLQFVRQKFPKAIFHSPGPITGMIRPVKTIVTLHDCLYRHFRNYEGRFLIRGWLSRSTERFAARTKLVLTDSEFSRQDLITHAKIAPEKIEVLYPWVGREFLAPISQPAVEDIRKRLCLPERFWLYVGGYDYRKNVEFLLAAYAAASGRASLPPLVLAGRVPLEQNTATCDVEGALQRNRLTTKEVLRPGLIASPDLAALYRAASLFVFPSLGEGFGLPPAEAMAVGCPVLASNVTSLPEIIQNRDCLFDPQEASSLIEKLLAAAIDEKQFLDPLPPTFTEEVAIARYLKLLHRINGVRSRE